MLRASMILLATCLMLGALSGVGNAQQPATPAPAMTNAAADSSVAPPPTAADSLARADSTAMAVADSTAAAAAAAAGAAPVAAGAAAAPTAATPAPTSSAPAATTAPPPPAPTSAAAAPAAAPSEKSPRRLYYGGTLGIDFFGDQTRFYIEPMVGMSLTPRLSAGVKVGYERLKVDLPGDDLTSDNWGASVFGRLKVLPIAYAHVEFATWRYETVDGHESVPYILVGGGLMKPIAPRTSLMVEVLYDVLQDDKSPYDSGEPWVSFGVGVGF